jgi:type IV secretion system protein TrbL
MLGRVRPALIGLGLFLIVLEATKIGCAILAKEANVGPRVIRWAFKTAVIWTLLTVQYASMVNLMYRMAIELGLRAGGDVITVTDFLDPGQYFSLGWAAAAPLAEHLTMSQAAMNTWQFVEYLIAWLLCVAAYCAMGCTIFIAQVELSIGIIGGLCVLPFMLFSSTSWIAQGAISYPVNKSFRMLILGVLASVMFPIIKNELSFAPQPTQSYWQRLFQFPAQSEDWTTGLILIAATWGMALVYLSASKIASSILSGVPALSGGQVLQAATGTAVTGAAVITGGVLGGATLITGISGGASAALALPRAAGVGPAVAAGASGMLRGAASAAIPTAQAVGSGLQHGLISGARYLQHDGGQGSTRAPL